MKIPQLNKKPELKSCHNVDWKTTIAGYIKIIF